MSLGQLPGGGRWRDCRPCRRRHRRWQAVSPAHRPARTRRHRPRGSRAPPRRCAAQRPSRPVADRVVGEPRSSCGGPAPCQPSPGLRPASPRRPSRLVRSAPPPARRAARCRRRTRRRRGLCRVPPAGACRPRSSRASGRSRSVPPRPPGGRPCPTRRGSCASRCSGRGGRAAPAPRRRDPRQVAWHAGPRAGR